MNVPLRFQPLTPWRWKDFEILFGVRGSCTGCWCMYWKLSGKEFEPAAYEGNHLKQKALVDLETVPGMLAYSRDTVVCWVAVEPRVKYPKLARSRILKPLDTREVWTVTCFFTCRDFRRRCVTIAFLRAVVNHVRDSGDSLVEGYPFEPRGDRIPAAYAYTGLGSAFRRVGFKEEARRSPTRPIFRFKIEDK